MPWLQTVTSASKLPPGRTLGGPLTAETTRSGRLPAPMTLPEAALFVSMSSASEPTGSTIAPT
ncbi:hypothetical protein [Sorangium cellulosum]|uniref:Uncharacterized protein n=1 Tax=Sorangium cellulosum So0157-2 TaxID=1254432 RepID=S4Y045_SORCE|nr:hypothetical protein [Sorangium cellulosum]AGP37505.1 hypothetical protein SCE1572_25245 [Sorangium cellulosum So0157-2]